VSDLDLSANGRIVVVQANKVVELDGGGKKLREWDAANAVTATALPKGHVLVASQNNGGVCELDRAGKVVWEYRGAGCYRARRR
jgi:hypothetical protein